MKKTILLTLLLSLVLSPSVYAVTLVNDTWIDGTRDDPAAAVYSEMGVDSDLDGDLESAWFAGGSGDFDPVGAGGPLRIDQTTSSASLTTYFTPEGSEVTLGSAGDSIRVTWDFQVSGQVLNNTSHGMRIGLVDSPAASRVSGESTPGSDFYTGYSLFVHMNNTTFDRSDPIELYERSADALANGGNLLSSSSAWSAMEDAGTDGAAAYMPGVDYTFIMELTRRADGDLDIMTSMAGAGLDGTGLMQINWTAAPNGGSYAFDTVQIRPDGYDKSWEIIDTSLFKVEVVPEPATMVLLGLGGLIAARRKR